MRYGPICSSIGRIIVGGATLSKPGWLPQLIPALRAVLAGGSDPAEMLRLILDAAVEQTGANRGVFVEVAPDEALDFRVWHRMKPESMTGPTGDFSRSIFRDVIRHKRAVLLDNAAETERYADVESVRALRLISILCVPLETGDQVGGIVHLESTTPGHFTGEHKSLVEAMLEAAGPAYGALRAGSAVLEERDALRSSLEQERCDAGNVWTFTRFVGRAPVVRKLEEQVQKAARSRFPVLITGETGTGKGIIARVLHHQGATANGPFVTVFCPSLEKGLIESELFGHVRGAFTGADQDRQGKLAAAEGGTLFLDEIGELPAYVQPKLLRLLQEKTYERVGETRERTADVRIVAATHRDLEQEIEQGRFRRDLFERLNFLPLRSPALRERPEDIPLLLRDALDRIDGGRWIDWNQDVAETLASLDHLWPGNVREIEQIAARLSIEDHTGPLDWPTLRNVLDVKEDAPTTPESSESDHLDKGLPELMRRTERQWLQRALAQYPDLSRKALADRLKISETTLYQKLKTHGLT
ncbi:sigma-54-dependent Fis family transcriptional regulator [Moorena bouillonii]|uniref:Sigma-54 factor interaction domain-containing protein n=1 Tax=Moorena bouillonii PNG TaxID=568701 RepID=A0A1U7N786_9CYAN|nr:sigma-54-dependent Fis family transcriptional regulator [Moorena bouillonii]OLT61808.1 hypothetical protein BJP37_25050 [Moorena bouillonii PNG]